MLSLSRLSYRSLRRCNFTGLENFSTKAAVAGEVDRNESAQSFNVHDEIVRNEEAMKIKGFHPAHFASSDVSNLYNMRSGSYFKVTESDVKKYLPEGFCKSLKKEFDHTKQSMWMIRDTSKLVCRILDESEKKFKKSEVSQSANSTEVGLHSVIELPRYTDRQEWESAKLKCLVYGEVLNSSSGDSKQEKRQFEISKGEGSLVDSIVSKLKKNGIPDKILLSGKRGVGKSVVLNQLVVHARKRGWVSLYIPNGWEHVQLGPYVDPVLTGEKIYDNSVLTKMVLRSFWRAHKQQLAEMSLQMAKETKKYENVIRVFNDEWNRAKSVHSKGNLTFINIRSIVQGDDNNVSEDKLDEDILKNFDLKSFKFQTLEDLVLLGIALPEVAGLAFRDLVKELKIVENVPVLIAVDEYNTWFDKSAFFYDHRPIMGNEISVPNALQFLQRKKQDTDSWKLKNGLCVAATSFEHSEGNKISFEDVSASLPFNITIPNYNQVEYLSAISYYMTYSLIEPSFSFEDFVLFRTFTGSNPRLVNDQAITYFFPKSIALNNEKLQLAMLESVTDESTFAESFSKKSEENDEEEGEMMFFSEVEDFPADSDIVSEDGNDKGKKKKGYKK